MTNSVAMFNSHPRLNHMKTFPIERNQTSFQVWVGIEPEESRPSSHTRKHIRRLKESKRGTQNKNQSTRLHKIKSIQKDTTETHFKIFINFNEIIQCIQIKVGRFVHTISKVSWNEK